MFTKKHADENRQMAELGERLTSQGVTDYAALVKALQAAFPDVPLHRVRRAAGQAVRRWRYKKFKKQP